MIERHPGEIRVALFTDTFHQINGVAMVYERFAAWCARRGQPLEIFTQGEQPERRDGCVVVHSIPPLARVPYYHNLCFDALPLRPGLRSYIEAGGFDLVHIATQGHMAILALWASGRVHTPKISCYHTKMPEYAASRFMRFFGDNAAGRLAAAAAEGLSWAYQRRLYRSSELILAPTESARELIERRTGKPAAIFARGVDAELFSPDRRAREAGGSEVRTIYVGRLSVEKNLDLLAKLDIGGGRGMLIVGDGPFKRTLQRLLPKAEFPGFLVGRDLAGAYASADILAFPSRTETFGNAVLEAMASGLPVIVSNEGGPKDFVRHGETGFVAASDEEFIRAHKMLIGDPRLRKRIGAAARRYALTCDWDMIFEEQVLGAYRRVIERCRERSRP